MPTVETLIAECAGLCGSQNALARAIGTTPGRMSDYRTGRVPIPPPHLAALCEIAQVDGDEARRLLAACECDNPKNKAHRDKMRRAFFACWATGAAIALELEIAAAQLTLYTLCAIATPCAYVARLMRRPRDGSRLCQCRATLRVARPWQSRPPTTTETVPRWPGHPPLVTTT